MMPAEVNITVTVELSSDLINRSTVCSDASAWLLRFLVADTRLCDCLGFVNITVCRTR